MDSQFATTKAHPPSGDPGQIAADRHALDTLFSAAYEELRRLAATVRRSDGNATLSPTTLVNEAWLKLSATPSVGAMPHLQFRRIAARAMRQVLVDAARRRHATRRGGSTLVVTFDESIAAPDTGSDQLLALDEALIELSRIDARQASMIEMRFFGGLTSPEIAQLLEISEATVLRDWRAARAWLARELQQS